MSSDIPYSLSVNPYFILFCSKTFLSCSGLSSHFPCPLKGSLWTYRLWEHRVLKWLKLGWLCLGHSSNLISPICRSTSIIVCLVWVSRGMGEAAQHRGSIFCFPVLGLNLGRPRFLSLLISLWTVLRSNPFSAKQIQIQLAVTSRSKNYKKPIFRRFRAEIVSHGDQKDEHLRRTDGKLAVSLSSISDLNAHDLLHPGDYIVVIDCMTFAPGMSDLVA